MSDREVLSANEYELLASVPFLNDAFKRDVLLSRSGVRASAEGEIVVAEGDEASAFYLLVDGVLEVTMAGSSGPMVLGTLRPGDWFGEEAVMRRGLRTATVRAVAPSRCVEVPREVFEREVLADAESERTLRRFADVRLAERSLRSLAFFADLDPDEEIDGVIVRRHFAAGETVFAKGTPADTMGFVLDGIARVVERDRVDGAARLRLGAGQTVGEQDALAGRRRACAVVAETPLTLLEVKAERFRRWVRESGELADWVGNLQNIHRLADGRTLTVYETQVDGWACAVTVCGDPSDDGVTTTDRIGQDHLVIARCRPGDDALATVRYEDGERVREIGLANAVIDRRGVVKGGTLVRVEVQITGPDVGQLYRRILLGDQVTARDLTRFRRTGHLGGATRASERALLCQCLQIAADDVVHADSVDVIERETGAGSCCGGCRPALAELVALRTPLPAEPPPRVNTSSPARGIVPEVRDHAFAFATEPLRAIRAVPEVMLIAVTSLLSTPAERLIIGAIGEAAPRLEDPELAAAAEAFLAQESNHIAAHAPLNAMLLGEIYPYAGRLRRLGEQMLARYRDRSLPERLAVAAAYEYASDSIFGVVYDVHFREGRHFHRDPVVHEAMVASGIGPLFSWHALEELTHRHVAYEIAVAMGVSRTALRIGMVQVLADLARLQFPALLEMILHEPDAGLVAFSRAVFVDPGFVRTFAGRIFRWAKPDFDPGAEHYPFLGDLADDVDRRASR